MSNASKITASITVECDVALEEIEDAIENLYVGRSGGSVGGLRVRCERVYLDWHCGVLNNIMHATEGVEDFRDVYESAKRLTETRDTSNAVSEMAEKKLIQALHFNKHIRAAHLCMLTHRHQRHFNVENYQHSDLNEIESRQYDSCLLYLRTLFGERQVKCSSMFSLFRH